MTAAATNKDLMSEDGIEDAFDVSLEEIRFRCSGQIELLLKMNQIQKKKKTT